MVLLTAIRVAAIAVGTTFVGLLGVVMGVTSLNVTMAVVLRTALVIALLLALTRAFRIRDRTTTVAVVRPPQLVLVAAGLGYLVNPFSWGGHTLFGQLLVSAGVFSALIDWVVWMAVAAAGVLLGERSRVKAAAATVPYS